jgi:MSHA biogenesis protein MshO
MREREKYTARRTQRGVTLIELVVTITLLAIVAMVGSTMMTSMAGSQRAGIDRLAASGAADGALRRMSREVQGALPNSLRVARTTASGVDTVFIEFVPVIDGGRFRAAVDATGAASDPLDFEDVNDNRFDVLGPAVDAAAVGQSLVIHNLGDDLADAYAGNNRRAGVLLPNGGAQLQFTANGSFPASTDSRRFFVVSTPVSFVCEPIAATSPQRWRLLRLAGYGWQSSQPTNLASGALASATSSLLIEPLAACDAAYSAALANIGLLTARLALPGGEGGSDLPLLAQVPVDNTP